MQTKIFTTGTIRGVVYTFEKVGEGLPLHAHGPNDVHITVVARGSVRCRGPEIGDTVYSAGALIDWPEGVEHEIVAEEDNSRVVNILKGRG